MKLSSRYLLIPNRTVCKAPQLFHCSSEYIIHLLIRKNAGLLDELASSGVKYNPNDVLAVTKTGNGKLVWLESGSSKAGMQHILDHADDFAKKGIQQNQIKDLVMESLTNGKVVGYQGRGTGRPIYEVTFGGKTYHTAITVGDNGFIVGANPTTWP